MTPSEELEQRLAAMSPADLENRRRAIVQSAQGNYKDLSTEALQELAFITSTLRRRNAGPPKTARVAGKAPKATLDDLLV